MCNYSYWNLKKKEVWKLSLITRSKDRLNIIMFPCDSIYILTVVFSWWKDGGENTLCLSGTPGKGKPHFWCYLLHCKVFCISLKALPASSKYCVFYIHPPPRNHPRFTAWKVNVWAEGSKEIVRYFFIALEKFQILGTVFYILMSLRLFRMNICGRRNAPVIFNNLHLVKIKWST